jgi:predicted phage baseplate assembly protein
VLVQTAQLPVADAILDRPVSGGSLTLDGAYLSLAVGQLVAVTGVRADKTGETASEVVGIAGLSLVDGYTVLTFNPQLTGTYVRSTVTVNANVAPSTHGQSTTQILGSGDASQTFQNFPLSQTPLTYVSAATPSGAASTLVVRVNGVAWTEVGWLYGSGPTVQVYRVLAGADGKTYVRFGDGVTGACLPTGTNNVQATYRYGIGRAGAARAGQVSTLLSRPLGLKAVTNPLASTGAADPETIDQARPNAPVSVMTLSRIVSLEDAGNFAAASAGIAKAAVNWVWDGTRYVACVTVAGVDGAPVPLGSPQYTSLLQAMIAAGDGTLPLALCSYAAKTFTVAATITPDPTLVPASVLAAVTSALTTTFSFASRGFGQPVFQSEVITTMQNVPGVVAVTLNDFRVSGATAPGPVAAITASSPTLGPAGLVGAELVTLEPGPLPGVVIAS